MTAIRKLPYFPLPAEGETLFSLIGRCSLRLGIANGELMQHLTGQRRTTTMFSALPGYLASVSLAMPDTHPLKTTDVIINQHTVFPYFTYFYTQTKKSLLASEYAALGSSSPLMMKLGLNCYRIPAAPKSPRFCRACLQEQLCQYGFTYFHRAHQLPGVTICWRHAELLCDGCLKCGTYPLNKMKLTIPGKCHCKQFSPKPISGVPRTEHSLWLAQNSAAMVSNHNPLPEPILELRKAVLESGLSRGSLLNIHSLAKRITIKFGSGFLKSVGYDVWRGNSPSPWLARYFRKTYAGSHTATIQGLLILRAVFSDSLEFESRSPSNKVVKPQLNLSEEPEPDSREQWKCNLSNTLEENSYKVSATALSLGVSPWYVAKEASKQNLTIPLTANLANRIGKKKLRTIYEQLEGGVEKKTICEKNGVGEWTLKLIELSIPDFKSSYKQKLAEKRLFKHRNALRELMNKTSLTRTALMKNHSGLYDYMLKNDKKWFEKEVPLSPRKPQKIKQPRNDWNLLDKALANLIEKAVMELFDTDRKPIRVTTTMLLRKFGALQRYTANNKNFPRTSIILSGVVETREAFFLRKIKWAVEQLKFEGKEISVSRLRIKAGVPGYKVNAAIDDVRNIISEVGAVVSEQSTLVNRSSQGN